ncbi:AI-2E family transporter [uncultured Peptoniphilus sp.]|uniref:AI-2E family transporter n=1 Tax=uncultured Peptoniphilus sp. TaxID=254354 RepID=UPI002804D8A8|nr:AI-2E family transporter [uncultured Peptoniphilus sp.]
MNESEERKNSHEGELRKKLNFKEVFFSNDVYKKLFLMFFALAFVCYLFLNQKSLYGFFVRLLGILFPFVLGAAFAFIIKILLNFYEEKLLNKIKNKKFQKFKRSISILLSFMTIFLMFFLILSIVVPQCIDSFAQLQQSLPSLVQKAIDKTREVPYLNEYSDKLQKNYDSLSWSNIFKRVRDFVTNDSDKTIINSTFKQAFGAASNILGGFVNFVLALISAVYILSSKETLEYQFKKIIFAVFPPKVSEKTLHVFTLLHDNFEGFVKGQVIDSTVLAVIMFAICFITGMPNTITLAVLVGVTNLIPIIGPFIGGAVGFILIVIENSTKAFIFILIVFIMQQLESNFIYPRLVGGAVGLPALWTLVAITVGGSLFGVVGMWIFIPLTSTIYTLLAEYTTYKLNKKSIKLEKKKI